MRHHTGLCLLLTVPLGSLIACASVRAPAPTHLFLERSYVFRTPSDDTLLYEAQAATHVFLIDRLPDAVSSVSTNPATSKAWGERLLLTPMFRVRQLTDSSAAVRTPSFFARLAFEEVLVVRSALVGERGANVQYNVAHVLGGRLSLTHHSNGQAGCFRDGFVPIDASANACRPRPALDTIPIALNRANGDFSSTFVTALAHYTAFWKPDTDRPRASAGFALGYDYHPSGIFGALSPEQRALYGSWRARAHAELMVRSALGRTRLTPEFEFAPRVATTLQQRLPDPILRYRWSVEVSQSIDALLGAGAFIRWHDGQDYYNIGFWKRRKTVNVGIMLDASGQRIGAKIVE